MRIEWTLAAIEDREAIFDYIEIDSPRAAVAVDDRIEAQVDRLIETPEAGRVGRVAGTRELVLESNAIYCRVQVRWTSRTGTPSLARSTGMAE